MAGPPLASSLDALAAMEAPAPAMRGPIEEPEPESSPGLSTPLLTAPRAKVDMTAHAGLRGLCATYVLVNHSFLQSYWGQSMNAALLMPIFFLLSGFGLTVGYGGRDVAPMPCCRELCPPPHEDDGGPKPLDAATFYRNRMAKILPVYWLVLFASIPLYFVGQVSAYNMKGPFYYSNLWSSDATNPDNGFLSMMLTNVFAVQMWTLHGMPGMLSQDWFVSTIVFWYWIYPCLLPRLQRAFQRMRERAEPMWSLQCSLFWVQFVIGMALAPFGSSYHWPLSRLPVFMMGCFAGLACARLAPGRGIAWPWTFVPLPAWCGRTLCGTSSEELAEPRKEGEPAPEPAADEAEAEGWARRVDRAACLYMVCVFTNAALGSQYLTVPVWVTSWPWFDTGLVHMGLTIMLGLARDGGRSWLGTLCRTPAVQFLGQVSMCVYLVQFSVIMFVAYCVHGAQPYLGFLDCDDYNDDDAAKDACEEKLADYLHNQEYPIWMAPTICIPSALALGVVLERCVEGPASRLLAAPKRRAPG